MNHKSGFVSIVGNPNVGKSTLMNRLVGERISIITAKAQTTRHRIKGIVNGDDYQIVFSDTPGVLKPSYKMQEYMRESSDSAVVDADIILYVTDAIESIEKNIDFIDKVKKSGMPILLVINKIDLTNQEKLLELYDRWTEMLPTAEIFPVSAQENFNVDNLFKRILELLPEGEPYFSKDDLTDKPARFFLTEIVREKILLNYDKEVPYSVQVEVESFKETDDRIEIMVVIYVERDSQKGILIGKQGAALKKIGIEARKDAELFFGKKIHLSLFVKVEHEWRNKENDLKRFGYVEQ